MVHVYFLIITTGTLYGLSDKGWIDSELFNGWLTQHFVKYATSERPVLLLLDGHSSHYQPDVVRYARDHGIIMFTLPPHTTADSQPMDVGCFGPLKKHWREVCHDYIHNNPGRVVNRFQFSSLFAKAWMRGMTPANVISGYKACGIYPYNPDEVLKQFEGLPSSQPSLALPSSQPFLHDSTAIRSEFSDQQIELFETRYSEGYDIFEDEEYVLWLKSYHPEAVPGNLDGTNDDNDEAEQV